MDCILTVLTVAGSGIYLRSEHDSLWFGRMPRNPGETQGQPPATPSSPEPSAFFFAFSFAGLALSQHQQRMTGGKEMKERKNGVCYYYFPSTAGGVSLGSPVVLFPALLLLLLLSFLACGLLLLSLPLRLSLSLLPLPLPLLSLLELRLLLSRLRSL